MAEISIAYTSYETLYNQSIFKESSYDVDGSLITYGFLTRQCKYFTNCLFPPSTVAVAFGHSDYAICNGNYCKYKSISQRELQKPV